MTLRILDLFCGVGGAGIGYHRAGFEVVGVDNQKSVLRHYPFESHLGDAIEFAVKHGHEFDAIHASPPCQAYSVTKYTHSKDHPMMIEETRRVIRHKPYIIENVTGAWGHLIFPTLLCGSSFGLSATDTDGTPLRLQRHRLFETSFKINDAGGCKHDTSIQVGGVYGGGSHDRSRAKNVRRGGYTPAKSVRAELLGLSEYNFPQRGLSQAIPPVYTEHIGRLLIDWLDNEAR